MKILYALLLVMISVGNVFGQKEENLWMNGLRAGVDFNSGSAVPFRRPIANDVWRSSAAICDSTGNLLFFTNGFRIFNRNYEILENGDSLNLGDYLSYGYDELPIPDGVVIIPVPGNKNKFYVFHLDLKNIYIPIYQTSALMCYNLYYDIVDMDLDNGLGGVVPGKKEILVFGDTLTNTGIQAVKNGNGKDWWLICHKYRTNTYYRFLVSENGVFGPYKQDIGQSYDAYNAYVVNGDIRFNSSGSELIKNNSDSCLFELYDFDRCTGLLNNHRQIRVTDSLNQLWGLSFSPSGRYAYISANYMTYLYQFDLLDSNIESSKSLVGVYDGTLNPFESSFYKIDIGPDNKIYICSYDGNLSLHVINNPDSAGEACDFVQNQIELQKNNYWGGGMPNLPNYHLGSLEGCDTVITGIPPIVEAMFTHEVFPNPSTGKFQLNITGVAGKTEVVIYNTMGEVIEQTTLQPVNGFIHGFFNLQNQPASVYLLKAHTSRGEVTEKIVKE